MWVSFLILCGLGSLSNSQTTDEFRIDTIKNSQYGNLALTENHFNNINHRCLNKKCQTFMNSIKSTSRGVVMDNSQNGSEVNMEVTIDLEPRTALPKDNNTGNTKDTDVFLSLLDFDYALTPVSLTTYCASEIGEFVSVDVRG